MYRIGTGYDVHKLEEGLKLIVGGVEIPHTHGLIAHSDGDVLIHALCDAMLGAIALGDIGQHFSDQDPQFKGIDSKILLKKVYTMVQNKGYRIENIDCTIIAQKPKFAQHIPSMIKTIAKLIEVDLQRVSIKATTTEKLGFEGREEGISAMASVLLCEKE